MGWESFEVSSGNIIVSAAYPESPIVQLPDSSCSVVDPLCPEDVGAASQLGCAAC